MKYIVGLMFLLTLVFFMPASIMMGRAYMKIRREGLKDDHHVMAMFSFGAFV